MAATHPPERGPHAGAYAVVRGDEPRVFLADDVSVLDHVLALELVAEMPAAEVSSPARLEEMRSALMDERWADALLAWMEETNTAVDVYDEKVRIWSSGELDLDRATMEIRVSPLFGG